MNQSVETAPARAKANSLIQRMATRFGVDSDKMLNTLKATAFRQMDGGDIPNEQMMALMVVAEQYGLNPWTKEIYAFPDKKGGIVPVVGVDGWSRIINENPAFDGMDFEFSSESAKLDDHHQPAFDWCKCTIYRKDRSHPISVTEYFDEVYRPPFEKQGRNGPYLVQGPWQSHPKRFHRHKAMIQCARIAFGYVGIYDQDEAERIVEGEVIGSQTMGQTAAEKPKVEKERYPDAAFKKNFPEWERAIAAGSTTPDRIVETVSSCFLLSEDQVNEILEMNRPDRGQDNPEPATIDQTEPAKADDISDAEWGE